VGVAGGDGPQQSQKLLGLGVAPVLIVSERHVLDSSGPAPSAGQTVPGLLSVVVSIPGTFPESPLNGEDLEM
jgi:hypothetical protein